jgi:hypothetical protein
MMRGTGAPPAPKRAGCPRSNGRDARTTAARASGFSFPPAGAGGQGIWFTEAEKWNTVWTVI